MLYQILKPIVSVAIRVFYKRIQIENAERLNEDVPTLLIANHSNSFMDALVVGIFSKRNIYSLARGDAFKKKFVARIFDGMQIIPIYRKEEGKQELAKNDATFERCVKLLEAKEVVTIYPESISVTEKRLRKLRKGAARIAFRAEEKNNFELNLRVLPIGINYSNAKNFRSDVFIKVGEPILLKENKGLYKTDSVKAIIALTQKMETALMEVMVNIPVGMDDVYENAVDILHEKYSAEKSLKEEHESNMRVAMQLNTLQKNDSAKFQLLKESSLQHREILKMCEIPLKGFTKKNIEKASMLSLFLQFILLQVGLPLHLAGLVFNYLPYRLAYKTANKVKQIHFHASVNFAIGMFGWLFYYFIQLILIVLISKSVLITAVFALFIPLLGAFSIHYYSFLKTVLLRYEIFKLKYSNSPLWEKLLEQRDALSFA
ncbi:MAG: 1-acyl-sn-glycerol-3-phosphate acyltransferase [Bacteroidetes bacterium]|nr:1-acyl-sn-glycerol-3-phosphate acyltransferase [Bacteroidota bacterium]